MLASAAFAGSSAAGRAWLADEGRCLGAAAGLRGSGADCRAGEPGGAAFTALDSGFAHALLGAASTAGSAARATF